MADSPLLLDEPAEATPPIVMTDSTLSTLLEQAIVIIRLMIVIVGSVGTVIAFIKTKDLVGLVMFFKGEQGAGVIAAATTVITIGVGLWRTYVKRRRTLVGGKAAPNELFKVIEK